VDLINKENYPTTGTDITSDAYGELLPKDAEKLTPTQRTHPRDTFVHGTDLIDGTARPAATNLLLHGIGTPRGQSLIEVKDSLIANPGTRHTVVLSNPPTGRKSSLTTVGADGREAREHREIEQQDFVVTTSNRQLNFLQHIATILGTTAGPQWCCQTTPRSREVPERRCAAGSSPSLRARDVKRVVSVSLVGIVAFS